jgi:hypothetical protein
MRVAPDENTLQGSILNQSFGLFLEIKNESGYLTYPFSAVVGPFADHHLEQLIVSNSEDAKVMHRGTSKVVATTNARDLRLTCPSLIDDNACRTIGRLIAQRSMDSE